MAIPFVQFFSRVQKATGITTQTALAAALGIDRSAVTQAKVRDAVPQKWILALARKYGISPDWLEFGTGLTRTDRQVGKLPATGSPQVISAKHAFAAKGRKYEEELFFVPHVQAGLCAGGGSFDVDAAPVGTYALPLSWLSRLGRPSSMAFMNVVGDSMEPSIYDGDMVLVDQSKTELHARNVFAVGFEEAIYIKRVQTKPLGIVLHSDNPSYSPIEVFGDELGSFRVLGQIVWLCRDCRFL